MMSKSSEVLVNQTQNKDDTFPTLKDLFMSAVHLHVEIGSSNTVLMRYGDLMLSLSPEASSKLGRALIAAATAVSSPEPPDAGFHVVDAHLPVTGWRTGVSNINLEPILMLEVIGGLWLSFQVPPTAAREVAAALSATGTSAGRPAGQLLS